MLRLNYAQMIFSRPALYTCDPNQRFHLWICKNPSLINTREVFREPFATAHHQMALYVRKLIFIKRLNFIIIAIYLT